MIIKRQPAARLVKQPAARLVPPSGPSGMAQLFWSTALGEGPGGGTSTSPPSLLQSEQRSRWPVIKVCSQNRHFTQRFSTTGIPGASPFKLLAERNHFLILYQRARSRSMKMGSLALASIPHAHSPPPLYLFSINSFMVGQSALD